MLFAAAVEEAEQNDDVLQKVPKPLRKGGSSVFFTQLSGNEPEATDVPKGPPTKLRVMLSKARDCWPWTSRASRGRGRTPCVD